MRKHLLLLLFLTVTAQQIAAQCNLKIATTTPTLCEGQNISMTATGVPSNATLQWKKNGADIDKAIAATYQSNSAGTYELKTVGKEAPWNKINTDFTDFNKVFFVNAKIGWAIENDQVLKKTTDGGLTWTVQNTGINIVFTRLLNVYFLDVNNGFVSGSNTTLLKTTDGGVTWTPATIKGDTQYYYFFLPFMSFIDKNIGWVMSTDGSSLKTIDGGKTWIVDGVRFYNKTIQVGVFLEENVKLFVDSDGDIGKTINDGKKWEYIYQIPKNISVSSAYFQNNKIGWIVGSSGYVLNTTDGGETWKEKKGIDISGKQYFLQVLFTDSKTGFIFDTEGGYYKTVDGGDTWNKRSIGIKIKFPSVNFIDNNNGWMVGKHGTILKTTDGGTTWKIVVNGNVGDYISSHFVDNLTGYAVGNKGYIGKTVDGGFTWDEQKSNEANPITKVQFFDQNTGWALVPQSSIVLNTVDGGNTWVKKQLPLKSPQSMYFTNSKNGFVVGAKNIIYQTTDGGNTWIRPKHTWDTTKQGSILNVIHFSDSQNGWAAGNGILLNTKDNGVSWTQNTNVSGSFGVPKFFDDVFFMDNMRGVVLYSPYIDYTSDGGKTWKSANLRYQDTGYDDSYYDKTSIRFVNAQTGFMTRSDGSIFTSPDGGANWYYQSKLTSNRLNSLFALDEKNVWAVGGDGLIVKYAPPLLCNSNPITVNPNPTAPTNAISDKSSICIGSGGSVILSGSCLTGSQTQWYNGTETLFTNLTVTPTESSTYSVGCKNTVTTCETNVTNRVKVPVTVNPKPAAPTLSWSNAEAKLTAVSASAGTLAWLNGANVINNVTATTYQPTASGSYSVRVTDAKGCAEVSTSLQITILSSEDAFNSSGISLFPNPSDGLYNVALTRFGNEKEATLNVIGLDGQNLHSQTMKRQNDSLKAEVDVRKLPAGVYFLQVLVGQETTGIKISIMK